MDKESDNQSLISDKRPSFFLIILASRTPTTRHLIPPDFLKYIPDELGQSTILSVPSGRHWHIQLQKTEKGVYLQDGWKEFLNDNSLGDNEFLRFTYDGNMCFYVEIFDKTGCERNYVSVVTNGGSTIPGEKRKRGRPRKIKENSAPVTEKRKRGRPRKQSGGTTCIHNQLQSGEDGPVTDNEQDLPLGSSERPVELN